MTPKELKELAKEAINYYKKRLGQFGKEKNNLTFSREDAFIDLVKNRYERELAQVDELLKTIDEDSKIDSLDKDWADEYKRLFRITLPLYQKNIDSIEKEYVKEFGNSFLDDELKNKKITLDSFIEGNLKFLNRTPRNADNSVKRSDS